LIPAGVIGILH